MKTTQSSLSSSRTQPDDFYLCSSWKKGIIQSKIDYRDEAKIVVLARGLKKATFKINHQQYNKRSQLHI